MLVHWQHFPSERAFEITSDGCISHTNYGSEQKRYLYDPSVGTLTIMAAPRGAFNGPNSAFSMVSAFVQYNAEEGASIKKYTDRHNGRRVQVYEIEKVRRDEGMSLGSEVVAKIRYRIMADIKSKLMVAARAEWFDKNDETIRYSTVEADYPETGPSDIYALGVPRTARIVDETDTEHKNRQR